MTARNASRFAMRLGLGAVVVAVLIALVAPMQNLLLITAILFSAGVASVIIGGTIFWWSNDRSQ
jgi:hypothetical protein